MSDEKIVNLQERRKRDLPQYPGTLASTTELLKALIAAMDAEGTNRLVAAVDGYVISIEKSNG